MNKKHSKDFSGKHIEAFRYILTCEEVSQRDLEEKDLWHQAKHLRTQNVVREYKRKKIGKVYSIRPDLLETYKIHMSVETHMITHYFRLDGE